MTGLETTHEALGILMRYGFSQYDAARIVAILGEVFHERDRKHDLLLDIGGALSFALDGCWLEARYRANVTGMPVHVRQLFMSVLSRLGAPPNALPPAPLPPHRDPKQRGKREKNPPPSCSSPPVETSRRNQGV